MSKLVYLEFMKLKRSSMKWILGIIAMAPITLMILQYLFIGNEEALSLTSSNNNTLIPMSIFCVTIILTSYIFCREYSERTVIYLAITPIRQTKILISKLVLIASIILGLGLCSYGAIMLVMLLLGELTKEILIGLVAAWLIGSLFFFLLTPVIIFVALIRKNFISSTLCALLFFMFTYPFSFRPHFYIFPNLIPIVAISNLLGSPKAQPILYGIAAGILVLVFVVFLILSIYKINRKE